MGTTLIFSEIVFNFTVALAIIAIVILCGLVTYRLVRIARELEGLSRNLNNASGEAGERIRDIVDKLSEIPILSYFLKKSPARQNRKGREKSFQISNE